MLRASVETPSTKLVRQNQLLHFIIVITLRDYQYFFNSCICIYVFKINFGIKYISYLSCLSYLYMYFSHQAPPQHLLTAAVMSAPATLAIAKLNYPETTPEKSITRDVNAIRLSKGYVFNKITNTLFSNKCYRPSSLFQVNYSNFTLILNHDIW